MKAKHSDAILIFRMGDYYQIFNEDAEIAAPILGLNQAPGTLNQLSTSVDSVIVLLTLICLNS